MPRYKPDMMNTEEFLVMKDSHINFVIEYVKDFNMRRAAEASGYAPGTGGELYAREDVQAAIRRVLSKRLETSDITAEWVLMEAVDNALIAKQEGKISASNTALGLVAKHKMVDAFAADVVRVEGADVIVEKLKRARQRLFAEKVRDKKEESFL